VGTRADNEEERKEQSAHVRPSIFR
jgi:hypothetical protein